MNPPGKRDTSAKSCRVLLADDHTLVRAGIRSLLEKLPGVEVVGEADDGREVIGLIKTREPDAVLMDISMPGLNGLQALARVTRDFPRVRVLILSGIIILCDQLTKLMRGGHDPLKVHAAYRAALARDPSNRRARASSRDRGCATPTRKRAA